MPVDDTKFAMIAHGTDGKDTLEEGIHLRWGFNPKMGFPSGGFKLYRRISPSRESGGVKLDFEGISEEYIPLPYIFSFKAGKLPGEAAITGVKKKLGIVRMKPQGVPVNCLSVDTPVSIEFSYKVQQAELDIYLVDGGDADIAAMSEQTILERQTIKDFNGVKTVSFSAQNISSIKMSGQRLYLMEIRLFIVEDFESDWTGPINKKCGFGLPVNVTAQYMYYLITQNRGILPPRRWTLKDVEKLGPDWLLAACRIPQALWSKYKGPAFDELNGVLKKMVTRAGLVPMGLNKIDCQDELSTAQGGDKVTLRASAMDIVLMAALDTYIARMLGLYWVDKQAATGHYYDYRITANWDQGTLWNLEKCIDFKEEKIGRRYYSTFNKEGIIFNSKGQCEITAKRSALTGADRGVRYLLGTNSVKLYFSFPVREVQIFVSHECKNVKISAFHGGKAVDSSTLSKSEGILSVHSKENIDYVLIQEVITLPKPPIKFPPTKDRPPVIIKRPDIDIPKLRKNGIILFKVCTDAEYIEYGEYNYTLYGLTKCTQELPKEPEGLNVVSMPGMTRTDDSGKVIDKRFAAGLQWKLPVMEGAGLLAGAPAMYHINRQSPGTGTVLVTADSPVTVNSDKGRKEDSIFYTDQLTARGVYSYSIAALDIWGRLSRYTPWVQVDLKAALPPPPSDIEAKYLDIEDQYLSAAEKAEVIKNNRRSVLKVRWKWTDSLRRQAPDVSAFKVYMQPGWLNVVQGVIAKLRENGQQLEIFTDYINSRIPENSFAGEKLQIGLVNYDIISSRRESGGEFVISIKKPLPQEGGFVKNEAGTYQIANVAEAGDTLKISITVDNVQQYSSCNTVEINQETYEVESRETLEGTDGEQQVITVEKKYPEVGQYFSIPLNAHSQALTDYSNPSEWRQLLYTCPAAMPAGGQYEIYIPNPPLNPDINNKTLYSQIGFSSVSAEGEGWMSSPATVIAIYREKPPAQNLNDLPGEHATLANYYGKSSYALRWVRNSSVLYNVFRTMDETLFAVDSEERSLAKREGRQRVADSNAFIDRLGLGAYRNEIIQKIINPDTIDYKQLLAEQYKNALLKALANMPGNENSFTRINNETINPNDAKYANKLNYWEAQNTAVDMNMLLYIDDTLDGNAENLYFYRLRTVNEIGAQGDFGAATFPVYLRKAKLSAAPVITKLESGDRAVTLKWSPCLETGVAGYLVYRTEREDYAKDIRRMTLVKKAASDTYSCAAVSQPEYTDTGLEGAKKYFYRVVTVAVLTENSTSLTIKSGPSTVVVGQPYDDSAPEHPTWLVAVDGSTADSKILSWTSAEANLKCMVQRRISVINMGQPVPPWEDVSGWLERGVYTYEDKSRAAGAHYHYRLKVMDQQGRQNREYEITGRI